ncbi:MAG: helix-turn-helix domain-containing protein [Blastocatellales bacterium]
MPTKTLGSLAPMVRKKRGDRKLRDVAQEIGIGAATLMRVESGRIPDVATFGKICSWLNVDPGTFLGFDPATSKSSEEKVEEPQMMLVAAHLRVDKTPQPETINALAKMIWFVTRNQRATGGFGEDENT